MINKFNLFLKLKILIKKPKIVVLTGPESKKIKEKLTLLLRDHFKISKDIFIFELEEKKLNQYSFFFNFSSFPILFLANHETIYSQNKLPLSKINFVLNFDEERVKEIEKRDNLKITKFGFKTKNNIFISDIKENGGINFKINYKGSLVPFWLKNKPERQEINNLLAVITIGLVLGLNLVEISQSFRDIY